MALDKNIAILIGGVGGAKLALGLLEAAEPARLSFIVNTGDDFWHLGLKICPDLDTLTYTLAGLVDARRGWGLAADTLNVLRSLEKLYGVEPWFQLGDGDLATHLLRTRLLRDGHTLSEATASLTERLGIRARLLPMTDSEMPTIVDCQELGELGFQEYFVKHRWQPAVRSIQYRACGRAQLSADARAALERADIVLIAPSNPWLSIGPILALPGMRGLLAALDAPVVAVTPIIAGDAVKGPTAKIMRELGIDVSARSVAEYYGGMIDGFVDDARNEAFQLGDLRLTQMDTLMTDQEKKRDLAKAILDWIEGWAR